MYAIYTPTLTATAANVLADLVLIFTGTTNTALLSGGCDIANTTILTTYNVAGWTVHDAAAGTNKVVLKAPCAHDATIFKYVSIDTNTAGLVKLDMHQGWDAGTHTSTLAISPGSYQRINLGTLGNIILFSSARYIALYGNFTSGQGAAGTGAVTTGLYHLGFIAETEPTTWQIPGSVYIPAAVIDHYNDDSGRASIGYHRRRNGAHTAGVFTGKIISPFGGSPGAPTGAVPYYDCDPSGQRVVILKAAEYLMGTSSNDTLVTRINSFSDVCSIYAVSWIGANLLDTFVDHESKVRQLIIGSYQNYYWALLRG